jgi:hypothetical protein
VHGDAPTELARDSRRGFATTVLGQIQRSLRQAEAAEGVDKAAVLRAATPKTATPNKAAEQVGHA